MIRADELKNMLDELGYREVEVDRGLPYGVTLWTKRLGYWADDKNIYEYLSVFLQEVEGQNLASAVSPFYSRAHKYKKVRGYLEKRGAKIEQCVEYEDIVSLDQVQSLMKREIAIKRIDPSKSLRL